MYMYVGMYVMYVFMYVCTYVKHVCSVCTVCNVTYVCKVCMYVRMKCMHVTYSLLCMYVHVIMYVCM